MIAIGLMYLILLQGKIYTNENQSNVFCFKIELCAKMMFSLLLRLQIVNFLYQDVHQMGVIVVTIKLFLLVLQQPILIGWD